MTMNKRLTAILLTTSILATSIFTSACSTQEKKEKKSRRHTRHEEEETKETEPTGRRVPPAHYLDEGEETWFDQQGLEFTPNGNFDMDIYSWGQFIKVPANMTITTDYDCEEGYKNIIAVTKISMGGSDFHFWTSSFDKYTGTSFEFHGDSSQLYNGCDIIHEGDVPLTIKDYDYTFHIKEHIVMEDDVSTITYTITCPIEYDGTVLQYGAYGMAEDDGRVFDGGTTWRADEFTDMHGAYNYFTLQGMPQNAE